MDDDRKRDNYTAENLRAYELTAREFTAKMPQRLTHDREVVARFAEQIEPRFNKPKVLDIGTGSGQMAKLMLDRGWVVTGIEFSNAMAKETMHNAPGIKMIVDDFMKHDFRDTKFDGVLAIAFIHLFPSTVTQAVLAKIKSILCPGGVSYISTTVNETSSEGYDIKSNFKSAPARYRRKFTPAELSSEIKRSDFRILAQGYNGDPDVEGKRWMNLFVE